jgi:hypothetical protein
MLNKITFVPKKYLRRREDGGRRMEDGGCTEYLSLFV